MLYYTLRGSSHVAVEDDQWSREQYVPNSPMYDRVLRWMISTHTQYIGSYDIDIVDCRHYYSFDIVSAVNICNIRNRSSHENYQ